VRTREERLAAVSETVVKMLDELEEAWTQEWQSENVNQFWTTRRTTLKARIQGYVEGVAALSMIISEAP
jgi:hypothetical protein